jgi:hypothetical protein
MAQRSAHAVSLLAAAAGEMEPVLLRRCRIGRVPYDWRATATVGRFLCRGCGISGQCGACAELAGQCIPLGVVPALCALHGGLLEICIAEVALAVNFPAPVLPRTRATRPSRPQLTLLPSMEDQHRKEDAKPPRRQLRGALSGERETVEAEHRRRYEDPWRTSS